MNVAGICKAITFYFPKDDRRVFSKVLNHSEAVCCCTEWKSSKSMLTPSNVYDEMYCAISSANEVALDFF